MTETVTLRFLALLYPDGTSKMVGGEGAPLGWINECLLHGAVIHTIEVDLPASPAKPVKKARVTG